MLQGAGYRNCAVRVGWQNGYSALSTILSMAGHSYVPCVTVMHGIFSEEYDRNSNQQSEYSCVLFASQDSSVGIATRYGLDGSGIESRCGRDFPHLSRPALGPIQPYKQWVPGKAAGTWR